MFGCVLPVGTGRSGRIKEQGADRDAPMVADMVPVVSEDEQVIEGVVSAVPVDVVHDVGGFQWEVFSDDAPGDPLGVAMLDVWAFG